MEGHAYTCATCGETHSGLTTDRAFQLPDSVWAVAENERPKRAKWTTDLCQMGNEYFIRCLLPIPFASREGHFGWGVWVSVAWPVFERYLQIYEIDASDEPIAQGKLANELAAYNAPANVPVVLKFGPATQRPVVHFPAGANHDIAAEQHSGISDARYHEILTVIGVLEP